MEDDEYIYIDKALKWFLSFMSPEGWQKRQQKILLAIDREVECMCNAKIRQYSSMPANFQVDQIGYYLYLLEMGQQDIRFIEPMQYARIAPVFYQLGKHLDLLQGITGINQKIRKLLKTEPSNADATLFEILTALLWARNKWNVSFIAEAPPLKRPDLHAVRGNEQWMIECKRMLPGSQYRDKEQDKWKRMLSAIAPLLLQQDVVLRITFHVELNTLLDNFLYDQLASLVSNNDNLGLLFDNEVWFVFAYKVDYAAINLHLLKFFVKDGSNQIVELISGYTDSNLEFSYGIQAKYIRLGEGAGYNLYVASIEKTFGVFWHCDAENAINTKAKDIKRQLVDAIKQLPADQNAILHTGIETYLGPHIEQRRSEKILESISTFDLQGKWMRWIHIHFFQSYAPPSQSWVIDESHMYLGHKDQSAGDPLPEINILVPEYDGDDNLHWFKEQP
jgi:hypothetical protein